MLRKVFVTPFQNFIKIESSSGILLLLTTIAALVWANSGLGESYVGFWQYNVGIVTDDFEFKKPLLLWINDGLMAVFFFLIGLEIKREVLMGELNTLKKVAFPMMGALGGMLVPVGVFLVLNQNPETTHGWGIPMATDIAFSLAVLKTLGQRIPLSLIIFLTAFAIVDDIAAVLVIALFYSGSINFSLLLIAVVLLVVLYLFSFRGFYSNYIFLFFGTVIWFLFLKAGIHPTVAGILMAFSVPIRKKIDASHFLVHLEGVFNKIKQAGVSPNPTLSNEQIENMRELQGSSGKFKSPLQDLEHKLYGWVAYFIIPVFALANAGVIIDNSVSMDTALVTNIAVCLVLGKGIGITSVVMFAKRVKWISIPPDVSFVQILGVSFLAGIGFTMAIFIASLAFASSPQFIDSAKIGILIGSFLSAVIGYFILRLGSPEPEKSANKDPSKAG